MEIWGERVNEFFRAKLVAAPFFTDRSSEVANGGDTLYTPTTTEFTANAKSNGVAVSTNSPTDTKVTLSITNWFEASFAIEDREAAQVKHSYAIMSRYAKNCGYAIAKKLDTAITELFSGFSNAVGSSATNLADSDIRNAIAYIENANVDLEECAWFLHPNTLTKASLHSNMQQKTIEIAGTPHVGNLQPSPYVRFAIPYIMKGSETIIIASR